MDLNPYSKKSFGSDFVIYLVKGTRKAYCKKTLIALNLSIVPSTFIFLLKIHLQPIGLDPGGKSASIQVRLVAKGFTQKEGIDYFDTYAPVAKIATIRVLIALATIYKFEIYQTDVKTTFLNGESDEEFHMQQPEGFVV